MAALVETTSTGPTPPGSATTATSVAQVAATTSQAAASGGLTASKAPPQCVSTGTQFLKFVDQRLLEMPTRFRFDGNHQICWKEGRHGTSWQKR